MSLLIRLFQIPLASFNSLKPYTLDELEKADKKLALISKVSKAAALFFIILLTTIGYNVIKFVLSSYFNLEVNETTNNILLIFIGFLSCHSANTKTSPLIDSEIASNFGCEVKKNQKLKVFTPLSVEAQRKEALKLSTTESELFNRYTSRLEMPRTLSRFEIEHIKKAAAHD